MDHARDPQPQKPWNEHDVLGELSRAESVYSDAPPDQIEAARKEYVEAVRRFNDLKQG